MDNRRIDFSNIKNMYINVRNSGVNHDVERAMLDAKLIGLEEVNINVEEGSNVEKNIKDVMELTKDFNLVGHVNVLELLNEESYMVIEEYVPKTGEVIKYGGDEFLSIIREANESGKVKKKKPFKYRKK